MIQKKICMLGAFAVGKTSLVQRYVTGLFGDHYLTTVGVRVDKKVVQVAGQEIKLILWDLAGEDLYTQLNMAYLRGMAGYILTIDGTRMATFDKALDIVQRCQEIYPQALGQVALNKADLTDTWQLTDAHTAVLQALGLGVYHTSAKTAQAVEEIFARLART